MFSVALTGHTKGIGKQLAVVLENNGYTVRGFSRTNGFDISEKTALIVSASSNCDIFINNAHHGLAQCDLFNRLYAKWKHNTQKTIVNVLSYAKFVRPNVPGSVYTAEKAGLEAVTKQAMLEHDRQCRIINISPSYVDTARIAHIDRDIPRLTIQECCDIIYWAIKQPQHIEINELTFGVVPTHKKES